MSYIVIDSIEKSYGTIENKTQVLKKVSATINKGEICGIFGPSGSGKSTLLNIIGGLEDYDSGMLEVAGADLGHLSQKRLTGYRREKMGYVFQFYNLVPDLTIRENIQVCEYLSVSAMNIDELIEIMGLNAHQKKYPAQVSGGQQQRCAIARALAKNPEILLCDEPTGALDYSSAKDVLGLLEQVNKKYGTTILIVSHNEAIKQMVHHVIKLKDGKIVEDYANDRIVPVVEIDW